MCTLDDFQKSFKDFMLNRSMEEHMAAPKPSSSSFFYQQNNVNKTLKLPFFRCKNKTSRRTGQCFPEAAPLVGSMKVHRTKYAAKPTSLSHLVLPSHKTLQNTYTFKLKKGSLKKD